MLRIVVALAILCGLCYSVKGQKLLFHKKRYREAIYTAGDIISFQLKGSPAKITARITGFEDSLIVLSDVRINPASISHLYVDRKTKTWFIGRYKYERIFLFAGTGYLVLDWINNGQISKETAVVSGALISAGLLARWLISDKMKIKGRCRLVIIH